MGSLADAPELAVVLGGGIDDGGAPLASTVKRAQRAAQLAHERPELALICEAAILRDLVVERGISADRIVFEDGSFDTLGNAVLVAARYLRLLEPRPLLLITSPFHLERAMETFRHVLGFTWQVQAIACDETPDDVASAAAETRLLQETSTFFQGIKPGDLKTIIKRLRESDPRYAGVRTLDLA